MNNSALLVDKEQALDIARNALREKEICIIDTSLDALYRSRRLGVGIQDRGWVVFAKLDMQGNWDPDSVTVYVSDPDAKVLVNPIL